MPRGRSECRPHCGVPTRPMVAPEAAELTLTMPNAGAVAAALERCAAESSAAEMTRSQLCAASFPSCVTVMRMCSDEV